MASYTVHLTFSAPGAQGEFKRKQPLSHGRGSVLVVGRAAELAAVVVLKDQNTLHRAAERAADEVARVWRLYGTGPITLLTWTASRQRVLAGRRGGVDRASGTGSSWPFGGPGGDDPDDGGLAGVREPRRPKTGPPSIGMTLPLE